MDTTSARAAGSLVAMAAGDALGAPYEFRPPLPATQPVVMSGGGSFGWEPGEWTDDTSMAVPLLEAAESAHAAGHELLDGLDDVAGAWCDWALTAPDVGYQTRAVLGGAWQDGDLTADALQRGAHALYRATGRAGGNGSLMRTAPVALAYLGRRDDIAAAARAVSDLTHAEPDAGDACVLWCLAIDHAIETGDLDVRTGLDHLPGERRDRWASLIAEAEAVPPVGFENNGWVVHAFQAAWSAISRTHGDDHVRRALEAAVRAGRDTDTVACITGQLVGAAYGVDAVPGEWVEILHGWPGISGVELGERAAALVAP
ncbi:MAG: ADP-ribosylglycohydrolase family protein [Frankiales bacterium]|nr:ADP-ribosylglycohydrolase family protein [Frankiales bacterium]